MSIPAQVFYIITVSLIINTTYAEPDIYIQNKTYGSGAVVTEWSQYTIETVGAITVKAGANVGFVTGEMIFIEPGFKVEAGGIFSASIQAVPLYNPGNYYGSSNPTLSSVGFMRLMGQVGEFNLQPFDMLVLNAAGTAPLANAPVLITIDVGDGWLAAANDGTAVLSKTLMLNTDANGSLRVYYKNGPLEFTESVIRAVAAGTTQFFYSTAYTVSGPNADTDGDGLPDATEIALGTNPAQKAELSTSLGLSILTP